MKAASKNPFLLLLVVAGAALAHTIPALWAGYVLVGVFVTGDWSLWLIVIYLSFRVVTASLALVGLGFVAVALKRAIISKAEIPAIVVCIVGALILLEVAALSVLQTEVLLDGLPALAASAAVILAALAFGSHWSYAKYMARVTALALVGVYGYQYGGEIGAMVTTTLSWHHVGYASTVSELLSLTLPLVLLDLLCGAQGKNSDTVSSDHAQT
jgi:hypothetical protein